MTKSQSLFTEIYFSGVELYSELTLGICLASEGNSLSFRLQKNHSVSSGYYKHKYLLKNLPRLLQWSFEPLDASEEDPEGNLYN